MSIGETLTDILQQYWFFKLNPPKQITQPATAPLYQATGHPSLIWGWGGACGLGMLPKTPNPPTHNSKPPGVPLDGYIGGVGTGGQTDKLTRPPDNIKQTALVLGTRVM